MNHDQVAGSVRQWVESLVVAENLCPFAKRELAKNRVRFSVTEAATEEQLLFALTAEFELLDSDPSVETALLIHPNVLQDFEDYNQFLSHADRLLAELELEGVYQIASFHPDYQFSGTEPDDIGNYTNRSPHPVLHIIREQSLERAIADFPDVEQIPARNIKLMNSLGRDRLQALMEACLNPISFASLNLQSELLRNLESLGFAEMTPIQAQSLPPILAGKDVIAQGKTGSGKTAAFGLGLLSKLDITNFQAQSLVLCPTRELADQVANEIRRLGRTMKNVKVSTLCGGMPFRAQADSLEYGTHIIVGTPGRVEDHLRKGTLDLSGLSTLVLDEADRMLDMGFQDTLDTIIEQVPKVRQTLLFSATYPEQIQSIAKRIMIEPEMAQVESRHDNETIRQHFYEVRDDQDRLTALRLLLLRFRPESAVVFCNTKREAQDVASDLREHGFAALALHGDLEQRDRDQTLVRFANKSATVLVATDVAARGLDIALLDAVINYHIARDTEVHLHRIGRTGRAGSKGTAYSLISDKESYKVALLQDYLGQSIVAEPLPPASLLEEAASKPQMATLLIDAGKKQKIRPGDILGALTGTNGIAGAQVGKIDIFDNRSYVAVKIDAVKPALKKLAEGKLKGRSHRSRLLLGFPEKKRDRGTY